MKRNALWLLALVLAMGLLVAGCGDDDDDSGDDSAALTKEEYLAKGNAICKAGDAEIEAGFEEAIGNEQPSEQTLNAVVADTLVPSIERQIGELREGIPEGDEDQVTEMLDEAELAVQDIKEDPSLATSEGGEDPFAAVNPKLNAYGLTACGSTD